MYREFIYKLENIYFYMKLDCNLAEFSGIMLGDGHLRCSVNTRRKDYFVNVSGSKSEDLEYYETFLLPLFSNLFNESLKIYHQRKGEINARKYSKKIVYQLIETVGLKSGPKDNTTIPKNILLSSDKAVFSFLRGLSDADGSLMFKDKFGKLRDYPVIKFGFKSKLLVEDLEKILRKFNFKFGKIVREVGYDKRSNKTNIRYNIFLNGKPNLEKWMDLIGFNNPRHLTKYQIYKKFGYCPKRTTLNERKLMLK